ncbi:MAG: methyltransferase type 11, partial [Clostridia bacterium]|nr:methyltransferase type 11 [Clostridia bacterium]
MDYNTYDLSDLQAIRPVPNISETDVVPYYQDMDPQIAVRTLLSGNYVLIADFYSSGLTILNELKSVLKKTFPNQSFKGQRDSRSEFRELSNRLLLLVSGNKLVVKKAPEIGWLEILYPEISEFALPFPKVQGLNSSWQWYLKGLSIPLLNRKIHPFYGTYFPTCFEHLTLFDNWLKQYKEEK